LSVPKGAVLFGIVGKGSVLDARRVVLDLRKLFEKIEIRNAPRIGIEFF